MGFVTPENGGRKHCNGLKKVLLCSIQMSMHILLAGHHGTFFCFGKNVLFSEGKRSFEGSFLGSPNRVAFDA